MIWMDVDAALSEVPVNAMPLIDDTDFKTRETAVAYNAAGMDLVWNFVTTAGAYTQTAVTPTTGGNYDWANQGDGMYSIEIPASGGASINNDTEGFGWFTGVCTGVLPWAGPIIGFRASGLNDKLIDSAYDTTRALAGTALPGAAAEAAGGLYTRGSGAGQINQPANGLVDINALRWNGTAVATPKTAGVPVVDWVPSGWRSNTAQAGAAGSITLDASASATDDLYKYSLIMILSGTGAGQARLCTAYNGTTKVATISPNWTTNPSSDSVFATMPLALADVATWLGAAPNALQSGRVDAYIGAVAAGVIAAASFAAGAFDAVWSVATRILTAATNITSTGGTTVPQTGDSFARIGANGAGLSAIPWNAAWDAEVQSEVNDALVALKLDKLISAAVAGADVTDDSIIAKMVSKAATADWDTFDNTTDSMEALADAIATVDDFLDTEIAAILAAVDTEVAAILSDTNAILDDTGTSGVVVAAASKTGYRLSATGVDDIWDEVMEGSYTGRQYMRGYASALLAILAGAATTTVTIRDTGDTKDRVTATVDADGNRSAVTLDLT